MNFQLLYLSVYCVVYLLLILLCEWIHKKGVPTEYTRKFAHILSALFALPLFRLFPDRIYVLLLVLITFLVLWAGNKKRKFASINEVGRITHGAYLLPLGIGTAFLVACYGDNESIYLISVSILALSDPLAFGGGKLLAPKKSARGKTFAGSFVFFLSSFLITFLIITFFGSAGRGLILAAGVAATATFTEFFSVKGTDNVTVPLFASLYILISGI